MTQALIALGSNLGDRRSNLETAIRTLAAAPEVGVQAVSPFHETRPIGGPDGQSAFLNAAAALETDLAPESLLDLLNQIEAAAKRVRVVHWGARTLDLDLLLYGNQIIQTPRLTVPHPRMALRRFVLAPLNTIAPDAIDPITTRSIAELLANLDRRPSSLALFSTQNQAFTDEVHHLLVSQLGATGGLLPEMLPSTPPKHCDSPPLTPLSNANPTDDDDRWLVYSSWSAADITASRPLPALTFAVILSQGGDQQAFEGLRHLPQLVVNSSDPEQIVAEILTTCAATRD